MTQFGRIGAVVALACLSAACSSITNHRGYIVDETLMYAIQPGIDNERSVEGTLGQPSFKSQFGPPTWYYVSSTTKQAPFTTPHIDAQTVLAVKFDKEGNVVSADRSGMENVVRIHPNGDSTPTLGRERSFLEDLFGNIGQVGGMPGAGAGGAGGPGT
ncbi:outer membrane protein assembly factor BamE [Altericroceibacterium spongiae]|uniref:Outer membrane protein assembly factor BamE n=1 Tax=Altericroceibacterium spongiae TaxID=2320269 RepID=A0A420EJ91_9SPHN|nr:outer membrane protein assembly factor BamE [Altericroceibacterium spongiae]RKF20791.1 outer membrane protein assembly factor BamE [Altericroceibacterium spongiae]